MAVCVRSNALCHMQASAHLMSFGHLVYHRTVSRAGLVVHCPASQVELEPAARHELLRDIFHPRGLGGSERDLINLPCFGTI
eukprot:SAG31_NODE_2290_length_5999_cov_3.229661_2_plen_82_part_00